MASYPPNAWGLFDMHGNLAQWCADSDAVQVVDPKVSASFAMHMIRGGSWRSKAVYCRAAFRLWADGRNDGIGFRVAIDPAGF